MQPTEACALNLYCSRATWPTTCHKSRWNKASTKTHPQKGETVAAFAGSSSQAARRFNHFHRGKATPSHTTSTKKRPFPRPGRKTQGIPTEPQKGVTLSIQSQGCGDALQLLHCQATLLFIKCNPASARPPWASGCSMPQTPCQTSPVQCALHEVPWLERTLEEFS